MNRDSTVDCIKSIHALSERVEESPALLAEFLVAIGDLDSLWDTFILNQQAVLDALLDLDTPEQFTPGLQAEIRALYTQVVMVADRYKSSSTAESTGHHDGSQAGSIASNKVDVNSVRSRLPEIPLPSYSGDLSGWPVFRDRFNALVAQRNDLSNIERFYYLLGCLKGDALHAIRNIAVSENTYALAWSTLVDRFDKPRQLATLIVDKLISIPAQSQESLEGLKEFLVLFSDQVATLDTLNIPNLGEFLLFALSARCLPLSTRKGFEAINALEFPTASDMVQYVKSRVSLLEAVQFSSSSRRQTTQGSTQLDRSRPALHRQGDKRSKVTLLTSKTARASASKCVFCSQDHVSDKCLKFMKLSLDARFQAARDKILCFRCLNSTHWSSRCKVSKPCDHCTGRHHTLLHRENHTPEGPLPETSLNVSALDQPTLLLGTALVYVRDQAGCMQSVRALIDSASQISVMTTSCVERLGLKRKGGLHLLWVYLESLYQT